MRKHAAARSAATTVGNGSVYSELGWAGNRSAATRDGGGCDAIRERHGGLERRGRGAEGAAAHERKSGCRIEFFRGGIGARYRVFIGAHDAGHAESACGDGSRAAALSRGRWEWPPGEVIEHLRTTLGARRVAVGGGPELLREMAARVSWMSCGSHGGHASGRRRPNHYGTG